MRTKTLLIAAAVGAAGMMTASAQVYSVNAVGYVNITLPVGPGGAAGPFALVANPLNGTNNLLSTVLVLPESADGTTAFIFDVATQNYNLSTFVGGFGWAPDATVPPGEAFFVQAANTAGTPVNVTFVGEVPQGTLVNAIPASPAFGLKSSIVPQTARLGDSAGSGTLLFPAEDGDTVYTWNVSLQDYGLSTYVDGFGWAGADPDPAGPLINVATGFFIQKGPGTTKTSWTRNFSVNP